MKRTNRLLSLLLIVLMVLTLVPNASIPVHAAYEDGDECWNCGHYHWDEFMHECGACSPACTNDWCALETHCHRCGGCLNGDYPCDECGLCKECMDEIGHCSQCDTCWMDYGADDVLCGNCRRCEFCSPICPECGMCEDCAGDSSDGMHCPECGNCYQITEQCMFVENNHCKDCCEPCEQCGECIAGDHLETCDICGLCVQCCEFNSMMAGCESGEICVASSDWIDCICEGCGTFFENESDLCETCHDAGVIRCPACCELASECSEKMCEYDDEYEDHFCIDCGSCFHDVALCDTCAGAGEFRCENCCADLTDSMDCDGSCGETWCSNDTYFEQHLIEAHDPDGEEHDAAPSNRWTFDEIEHWRACRYCNDDTPEEIAEAHKEETAVPHKLDADNKCVICGYVKGSSAIVTRQPRSVNAKVSDWYAGKDSPYHVKNNTVTIRTDGKLLTGNRTDILGYYWYVRVTDHEGGKIFEGCVEELRKDPAFDCEYENGALCNGFDSPVLTISVPYRACQWQYTFWCELSVANEKAETLFTVNTKEVQLKAQHLYTLCWNMKKAGAESTTLSYLNGGQTKTVTVSPSEGHRWYCTGCDYTSSDYTDPIETPKGGVVMHRFDKSVLLGESVKSGAKVYSKACKDCRYKTYFEAHQHVYHADESDFERYNRGSFHVNEEKTTNMAHALACLVEDCAHIKMETHEWDWRHMGYGSDAEGGGIFYRECLICGYPDYAYRPVDKDGNKINWTTKNVLVTAKNAQVSRTLAVEGDKLTLTINNNMETQGTRCTGWTVRYTTPDGTAHEITSAYAVHQNEDGTWSTTIRLAGYEAGGILLFVPAMEICTDHSYVIEGYVAPVCMYDGFAGYSICKYCHQADPADTKSDEERIIPAAGSVHTGKKLPLYQKEVTTPTGKTIVTWTTNKEASNKKRYNYIPGDCTTKGCEGDFLCEACERVIPGKREYKHGSPVERNYVEVSCFRDGYSGDLYCSLCDKKIPGTQGFVTPAPRHHSTLIPATEPVEPTCTTAGKGAAQRCMMCNLIVDEGEYIAPLGHEWVKDEENSTKYTNAYKCSRPGCPATHFDVRNIRHNIHVVGGAAYLDGVIVVRADEDQTLTLKAIPISGKTFKEWEVVSGHAVILNAASATGATFVMPDSDVEINAVYEDIPVVVPGETKHRITVANGKATLGGTEVTEAEMNDVIALVADAPETGRVFDRWVVVSGDAVLADAASAETTFVMPYGDVSVKAVYKTVDPAHIHAADEGKWESDEAAHWNACTVCGERMNEAAHTFAWVIDREPTKTETGLKHEACTVCGFRRSENTEIEKLPDEGTEIVTPPSGDDDEKSDIPETGDTSRTILWLAVLFVSGGVLTAFGFLQKKRRNHADE